MREPPNQPSPNRRLRIFLCHSSGDKEIVRDLYSRLHADGFHPWIDEKDLFPGDKWEKAIPDAVRACDVIVICLSRNSVTKDGYVQKEIAIALDIEEEKPEGTIFIIPVRIDQVEVPNRLGKWQWADLFHQDGYGRLVHALKVRARAVGIYEDHILVPEGQKRRTFATHSRIIRYSALFAIALLLTTMVIMVKGSLTKQNQYRDTINIVERKANMGEV